MRWRKGPRCPIVPQLFCALGLVDVLLACILDMSCMTAPWMQPGCSLDEPWMGLGWFLSQL